MITQEREEKFRRAIGRRQFDLTIILENVHDPHNIGAVLRTCDSVGIREIYVLLTHTNISDDRYIGKTTSSGAKKWVKVHFYNDPQQCFSDVMKKYDKIYATHLDSEARSVYELDMTESVALLFGNEHVGISQESLNYVNGNFIIPQQGLVQSLNISVACAVTLYEAYRQREKKGKYLGEFDPNNKEHSQLFDEYLKVHRKLK